MHPDQIYELRRLHHQDLRTTVEQARVASMLGQANTWAHGWLITQLRCMGKRHTHATPPHSPTAKHSC
jgi:hypothetical protein